MYSTSLSNSRYNSLSKSKQTACSHQISPVSNYQFSSDASSIYHTTHQMKTVGSSRIIQPFSKKVDMKDIFMSKQTIVKRMKKLMLDVKDLETKMFVSKVISYIGAGITNKQNTEIILIQKDSYFLKNNSIPIIYSKTECSQQQSNSSNLENNSTFACSLTNSVNLNNRSVFGQQNVSSINNNQSCMSVQQQQSNERKMNFGQTAESQTFFGFSKNQGVDKNILEEITSEAGTVQCQCGLFEALVNLAEKMMTEGVISSQALDQSTALQIDEEYINQLTQSIIHAFKIKQNQIESEKKQSQSLKIKLIESNKQHRINLQKTIQFFRKQISEQNLNFQAHKLSLSTIFKAERQKLSALYASKIKQQIQTLSKQHQKQKQSFQLQSELKDYKIKNLNTIVQGLKTKLSTQTKKNTELEEKYQQLQSKIIQNQRQPSIQFTFGGIKQLSMPENKYIEILQKNIQSLNVQNQILKEQCTILHNQLFKYQFNAF